MAALGQNGLAFVQSNREISLVDRCRLIVGGLKVHFDTARHVIKLHGMFEMLEPEAAIELTINAGQQIKVKLSCSN